jgi:tRNA threonylcarbamoyladenosine biosynthesis protein TsaB
MLVLAINTVGDACEAALVGDAGTIGVRSEPMAQGHDARLAPLVDELLKEAGVGPSDLDRIAVVAGPGSFTGVRVGVAFARGLALATGKPAVGVTSLEALDRLPKAGSVLGVLPAKRRPPEQSWWAQLVVDGRGEGEPVEADFAEMRRLAERAARICGDFEGAIEARPTAEAAARFARRLTGDLPPPRPIYARAPDATPAQRP